MSEDVRVTTDAPAQMTAKRTVLTVLLGLALLLALVAADMLAFAWFGRDYLRWYVKNGSPVFLAFAFISILLGDLDKLRELRTAIDVHPLRYVSTFLVIVSAISVWFANALAPARAAPPGREESSPWSALVSLGEACALVIGVFSAIVLAFWIVFSLVVWLLVIAPPQYFLQLFTGAPSRMMLEHEARGRAGPALSLVIRRRATSSDADGEGDRTVLGADPFGKPIALTNAFNGVVLWAASQLIG